MQTRKFFISFLTLLMLLTTTSNHAEEYCSYAGGQGYESCHETMNMTPAIALSAVALGVIVAFALLKSGGSAEHAHSE